jgi:hypothetical protein
MEPQIILAFTLLAGTLALGFITTSNILNRNKKVSNYRKTLRRGQRAGTKKN